MPNTKEIPSIYELGDALINQTPVVTRHSIRSGDLKWHFGYCEESFVQSMHVYLPESDVRFNLWDSESHGIPDRTPECMAQRLRELAQEAEECADFLENELDV